MNRIHLLFTLLLAAIMRPIKTKPHIIATIPGLTPGMAYCDAVSIESLREKLGELQDTGLAIQARADAETRDLTDDESTELDQVFADFEATQKEIGRRTKLAAQAALLDAGTGRTTDPDLNNPAAGAPAAQALPGVTSIAAARSDKGKWGWRTFGEYAAGVKHASAKGAEPDARFYAAPTTVGQEGVGADGGFAVPPDFRTEIMVKVQGEESLLARTDQMTSSSNSMTLPKDETTPWGTSGIYATWEGENDQLDQRKPVLKQETVRLNKLTALVPMTDELLEDAPAMNSYLNRKVPEAFTSAINLAIVQGNGAGRPLGIMNGSDLVTVAKESGQAADTVVFENIVNIWSRMYAPSRQGAIWLINQDIEPQLLSMGFPTSATAVPAYMPANGLAASPFATLMGRPVLPLEALETVGDLGDIILADMSKYLTIMKTGGIRSDVSIHLWFDYDTTAFRFIFRVAGQPHYASTIAKRDGSNTLANFVTLAARA